MSDVGTPYKPRLPHRELPSARNAQKGLDGKLYKSDTENEINLLCARVLGTPDGQRLLSYLRNITLNVAFEADVSQNALMHMEGQRWIVGLLVRRTAKGNEP